jgi:putative hydrolase of the HAD superfamily
MKLNPVDTVFVFDLDDTLYQEASYRRSGFLFVKRQLELLYKTDLTTIFETFDFDQDDVFGLLCSHLNLPEGIKLSLIWQYRLHFPKIELNTGVDRLLRVIESKAGSMAIITDGRSITQRLKIKALKLQHIPAFISEDYEELKPEQGRFIKIEQAHTGKAFVYIGDNPKKDFLAPNTLGWETFCVKSKEDNVHSQELGELDSSYHPRYWLESIAALEDFLC